MKFDLSIFKKSAASVAEHLGTVRAENQKAKNEHAALLAAPATRDEVKSMVQAWAERKAAHYLQRLQHNMQEFITNPRQSLNAAGAEQRMTVFGRSRQIGEFGMYPGPELQDEAICCLMGPALIQALHASIDAMPWPAGAVPLAGRESRLKELAEKIAELSHDEADLVEQARRALEI